MHFQAQPNHRPFTLATTTATQGEIAHRNREQNRTGPAAHEATISAIARIHRQWSATHKRLDSWVTHPDERVVIALLDNLGHASRISDDQVAALARRAMQRANDQQVLWTPLLDAVVRRLPFRIYDVARFRDFVAFIHRNEQAVGRWVKTSASAKDLSDLLTFRTSSIRNQIAANATRLDVPMVQSLMGGSWHDAALAENSALSDEVLDVLLNHVFLTILKMRTHAVDELECYIEVLHTLTFRGCTLSVKRLKALLRHLPGLREDIERACYWATRLGAEAVHDLLYEVTLETARRRLPELCRCRDDLAMLFRCSD
jgi:hypothetical protein